MKYIAFLRGINVGGNHIVKMEVLKKTLEGLGFDKVKTLIASGNVCFESATMDTQKLRSKIEKVLLKVFGFDIPTIIRSEDEIAKIIKIDPFKKIKVTPETRLYVTFLSEIPGKDLKKLYESPLKNYAILQVTDGEVFSVLVLTPKSRSVDSMNILGKMFGKNITTRNWNTVMKMAAL